MDCGKWNKLCFCHPPGRFLPIKFAAREKTRSKHGTNPFFICRWAEFGDLYSYLKDRLPVSEKQGRIWFSQLASAMDYLHSLNITHRDLKCKNQHLKVDRFVKNLLFSGENLLLTKKMNIKLADFGFARNTLDECNKQIMSETYCGSNGWILAALD